MRRKRLREGLLALRSSRERLSGHEKRGCHEISTGLEMAHIEFALAPCGLGNSRTPPYNVRAGRARGMHRIRESILRPRVPSDAPSPGFSEAPDIRGHRWLAGVARWSLDHLPYVFTLMGLVLFALIRTSYAVFYRRFGLTPEDLGISYPQILAQSGVAAVIFVLYGLIFWVMLKIARFVLLEAWVAISLLLRRAPRTTSFRNRLRRYTRGRVAAVLAIAFVAFAFAIQPLYFAQYADRATQGKPVLLGGLLYGKIPSPGVVAIPATVTWAAGEPPKGFDPESEDALMYLGEHSGTVFLYDYRRKETIRVPSSSVVVRIADQ